MRAQRPKEVYVFPTDAFASSVLEGLGSEPKRLESRYFYDDRGDALFREITGLPEYYLTACEREILSCQPEAMLADYEAGTPLDVVELGAGDGTKSRHLLEAAMRKGFDLRYVPIDISAAALDHLSDHMRARLPGLEVAPSRGDYLTSLHELHEKSSRPELLLFLGSNIGNYPDDEALALLASLAREMADEDMMLVGFDLRKDPWTIHRAYNDSAGLTREFNLNLLERINRELGGDFDLDAFDHYEPYDPVAGVASSFLVSLAQQTVAIDSLDREFEFEPFELIHTEISRKYSPGEIDHLAGQSGLSIVRTLHDRREYFADVLMRKQLPNP